MDVIFDGDDVQDLTEDDGLKTEPIESYLLTRGYGQEDVSHRAFRFASINISTWNPKYTVKARTDGVEESQTLCSDRVKSRTNYYRPFDAAPFKLDNSDGDHSSAYREDYSVMLNNSVEYNLITEGGDYLITEGGDYLALEAYDPQASDQLFLGEGIKFSRLQETMEPFSLSPRMGRYTQIELTNNQGRIELTKAHLSTNQGERSIAVKS